MSKEKKSQKEVFVEAYNELTKYNFNVTSILVRDIFECITKSFMVLDGYLIRHYENGNSVVILRSRINSQYCDKVYYLPVNILYPIEENDTTGIRIFLIVTNNTTVNKQCTYVNENNEIIVDGLSKWHWSHGLFPVIQILQQYFAVQCPLYEINPSDTLIPFSELDIYEKLGEGTSAVVYHGSYNGRHVALKKMRKIPSGAEYRYLLREFQTQMRFKHECILQIIGHSEDPSGFPILVMELGGSSLDQIIIKKKVKLSNEMKKKYLLDVARALEYLHSFNIIHRDIKLANVLLTDGIAKVADFGYAREIEDNKSIEVSFCGSPAIMAPELIETAKCSTKVDVYSFGCVVYEVIGERQCYDDMKFKREFDFYQKVLGGLRPTIRVGMPKGRRMRRESSVEPVKLMKQCWLSDKLRPTMKEIVGIIENWDPSSWDTDVISSEDLNIQL